MTVVLTPAYAGGAFLPPIVFFVIISSEKRLLFQINLTLSQNSSQKNPENLKLLRKRKFPDF